MPCMGPDLDAARRLGRRIGEETLNSLMDKYHLYDVTDPKYDRMLHWPGSRERWTTAKENFIKSVEELFVEDATNGF